ASPLLIKTPFSAPLPVPTIIAVGVAKPKAHGQAITRTEMVIDKANIHDSCPRKYQASPEIAAKPITMGTKIPDTLSANLAIGALDPCASSTSWIICARVVSLPTFVALNWNDPFLLIDAPTTWSPTLFSIGILSPVIMA